ncbi:MAG: sprT domain-containing protein, partial [Betaproteobacteria bacterium]|nr:sprT domain-containing protein [Betaproteobacteria bacterium]
IALNPARFAERSLAEILQALVREQCTLWQHEFGEPARAHYQNREWADQMISIGLMPSHTGEPGGRQTGQNVQQFVIKDGLFESACRSLMKKGFDLAWLDRVFTPDEWPIPDLSAGLATRRSSPAYLHEPVRSHFKSLASFSGDAPKSRNKVKYSCPVCRANVWGKPDLSVRCQACDAVFIIDGAAEMSE